MMQTMPEYRTRVRKIAGMWRVDYYLPYSGFLYAIFESWQEAMSDAWAVENQRAWT